MVPKIIHQIVGPSATDLVHRCLSSWKELENDGFKIITWNDSLIEDFLHKDFPFALDAFVNARNHGEASDIARYLIVYAEGGYYVDWDIELTNPEEFLKLHTLYPMGYLLRDPANGTLASEHFSAAPSEKFLLKLTTDIIDTYNRDERDLMYTPQFSGPYRMRSSLKRHPISLQSIIPVKDVFEYDFSEIRNISNHPVSKAMIHYWIHSWLAPKDL